MKPSRSKFIACLRDAFCLNNPRPKREATHRKPRLEHLEGRRVMTLPVSLSVAEGYVVAYDSPTGDVVQDTLSFDAFVATPSDVDSYYFAPQTSGSYAFNVSDFGNGVDPEVAVYVASTGVRIGYNDDVSALDDDARLVLNLTGNVRYIVAVADQPATTAGDVSLSIKGTQSTPFTTMTLNAFGDGTSSVCGRCQHGHRLPQVRIAR